MTPPVKAPRTSPDARTWNHLLTLHTRVESRLGTVLQRRHGLGLSEYRALGFLDQADKSELRMTELADRLGLNQSSVTRLVGRLNAAEFTYRDLCPDDKRGAYTVLTDAGRTRYREARTTYDTTLSAALDELAAADPAHAAIIATARSAVRSRE
ncbi:MarR family transcriptional regulator [Catenulispora sp. NL8]|uniref:MarR family transcriptional regulator n=1 Tax=Catenulispora pinistramenti TaxID=2705254 RepID=A0ABS5KZR1_9ACTN|nr:MarR family transcriptional regulator [Catenulispora pinistramenti]MBS2551509.1 MarR family transcriptional regulator [Catenulispora pinistramenti]